MTTSRILAAALLVFFGTTLGSQAARAADYNVDRDFRVDNAVYAEGQSQPQSQGVTIFHQGQVYDFLNDPEEIIVFDKAHDRFILLDVTRRVRSQISMNDVQGVVDRVQQRLAGDPSANVKWLVDPTFDESFNPANSELTLRSPMMTYRAQVQTTEPAVAAQYHEFSDWYTKFNLALTPSSRPPFPRIKLNEAIDRNKGIAKEVHLSTTLNGTQAPVEITSRHQLSTTLAAADQKRLAEAQGYMQSFRSVTFRTYRQGK